LRDHSWFVAYAPAEAPKIALAVLVENGGFGAQSAAPIARQVMDYYLLHRRAGQPAAEDVEADESLGEEGANGGSGVPLVPAFPQTPSGTPEAAR
jgi:penicillin-binding protein 2